MSTEYYDIIIASTPLRAGVVELRSVVKHKRAKLDRLPEGGIRWRGRVLERGVRCEDRIAIIRVKATQTLLGNNFS